MAKKSQKPVNPEDDPVVQQYLRTLKEMEEHEGEDDIGVVPNMYIAAERAAAERAAGTEGGGDPSGGRSAVPPAGGRGGAADGGRPAGRRSVGRGSADGAVPVRLNLIGRDVLRMKVLLSLMKASGKRGTNSSILMEYLERGARKDFPELVKVLDSLTGSMK